MRRANSLVASGEIELISTTILPLERPAATPSEANKTFSTSGVSGTIVKTMSDFSATSRGLRQATPPFSTISFGTPLRVLRKSLWPAACRWPAIGRPMMPRPMKPRSMMLAFPLPRAASAACTEHGTDVLFGQPGRQFIGARGNRGALRLIHGLLHIRSSAGIHHCVERHALETDGFVHVGPVHEFVLRYAGLRYDRRHEVRKPLEHLEIGLAKTRRGDPRNAEVLFLLSVHGLAILIARPAGDGLAATCPSITHLRSSRRAAASACETSQTTAPCHHGFHLRPLLGWEFCHLGLHLRHRSGHLRARARHLARHLLHGLGRPFH